MDKRELEQIVGDKVVSMVSLGGGCIANTSKITSAGGKMMVLKEGGKADMFLKEANGLKELQKAHVIQVPDVISARCDHLLIEFVPQGSAGIGFFEQFGRCMALLHQHTAPQFGFYEDNYIGAPLT